MAERILVIGSGTMGSGIAQVAAQAGHPVWLCDVSIETARKGRDRIAAGLAKLVAKDHLEQASADAAIARIVPIGEMAVAADFDVAIEAVREELETKRGVFAQLEAIARPDALILTNTSMISITAIARDMAHPERAAGCHFFNPVPRMKLVEVIGGKRTAPETLRHVTELVTGWGKTAMAAPDTPGFIVNRAFCIMINEAAFLVQEGTPPADIDCAMKLGCNHPMGPLELMDLIGVDVALACIEAMWLQFDRAPKYEPCELLREMVRQGRMGRKSGEGFYPYPS